MVVSVVDSGTHCMLLTIVDLDILLLNFNPSQLPN